MQQLVLDRSGVSLMLNSGREIASKITITIKTTKIVFVSVVVIIFQSIFVLKIYKNNIVFLKKNYF
jgi:hypothetical protein